MIGRTSLIAGLFALVVTAVAAQLLTGCGSTDEGTTVPAVAPEAPRSLDKGLLLALSQFEISPEGKVLPKPGPALLEILTRKDGEWHTQKIEDEESNVFHKAMVYTPPGKAPGILTLGGNAASVKLWRRSESGFDAEVLWRAVFGGEHNRMRDVEVAPLIEGDASDLAIATHDQGVVAVLRPLAGVGFQTIEIDRQKDTFVHEIEIGDLDGDGVLEVYATPSEPNRLDGTPQSGKVVRYIPGKRQGRFVVADLGTRHAKEILVDDVDGDGRDELYVSVEGEVEDSHLKHPVEIRRYDAGTEPTGGASIAAIEDHLCRFLTAGDVDGDGKREMVAAAMKSGLWLLRPPHDPKKAWSVTSIDKDSSGFEHASLLTDLDGDGTDELYVASDDQGEIRRYVWTGRGFARRTIFKRPVPGSVFTWNLMPVPVDMLK
jgi:hypothetical protein